MSTPKLFQFKNSTVDLNSVFMISTPYIRAGAKGTAYYVRLFMEHDDAEFEGLLGDIELGAYKDYERLLERWASDK